jgi:sucrose-6-phosphate hydrolase SacC (GH32 family)
MTVEINTLSECKQSRHDVNLVSIADSNLKYEVKCYTSEREMYRSHFKQWSKMTAQAILEMCRVVYDAKKALSKDDFITFVDEIGHTNAPATIRKFVRIGEKYELFYQYAELLPESWTSIYQITQLPADVFEILAASESNMKNMTGAQIKELKDNKSADATSSKTELSSVVTEHSDAIQAVSINTAAALDVASNASLSASDHEFAKQATTAMLERASSNASTKLDVEIVKDDALFEIRLLFNSRPAEEAIDSFIENLSFMKKIHKLDFEISSESAFRI